MSDIKPELIELLAKAIYERLHSESPDWEVVPWVWREVWLDDAQTALEVAGPVIAAQALRDAAIFPGSQLSYAAREWLRARADRIEAGSNDE